MPALFRLDMEDRRYQETRRRFLDTLGQALQAGPQDILIQEPKRTDEQNRLMWAVLHDLADQVGWHKARWRGNQLLEEGRYVLLADDHAAQPLKADQFKDVLTAALVRPRLFGGIDGGTVAVGISTSRMTKRQMSELIDLAFAFGAEKGVVFTEPRPTTPET